MKSLLTSMYVVLMAFNLTVSAQNAEIKGTILDEFGYPLAGADVILEGTTLGAQSNLEGRYVISDVTPGSYNLTVSYLGYASQTLYNIIVKSKGTPEFNFTLEPQSELLEGVTLSTENTIARPKESPLSTRTLSAVELATYPGGNNDVVQVAQTLPGVSPSVGGFRNDLIIRGGAPNESVYYLDGIEIPNINHFSTQGSAGGPVGLINVSFIENVTLSASSFEARYNNPLSGVLQFKQRSGSTSGWNRNIRVSASETAITLDGPLSRSENPKTTLIASVRRSYLQFLFELIGLPFRPNYWDYQYKLDHQIDEFNSLSFIGIGAIDDFTVQSPSAFDPEAQAQLEQAPFIDQQTHVAGISWNRRLKNNRGRFGLHLSHNRLRNQFTQYRDPENELDAFFSNNALEAETKVRFELTQYLGEAKLAFGANYQWSDYQNRTISTVLPIDYNTEIGFSTYGFFSQLSGSLHSKLEYTLGLRLDHDTFTTTSNLLQYLSPRGAITYNFSPSLSGSISAGRYYKIPTYTQLGFQLENTLVNRDSEYTLSDHVTAGLKKYFGNSTLLSIEGFYKRYDNYPVSLIDQVSLANKGAGFEVLGNEAVVTTGKGKTYGVELLFQQKLSNNLYGLLSYTFFHSKFSGLNTKDFIRSTWDSRHLASFTGGYKLPKNWEVSSRFRYSGKTPYAPVNIEATLANYPNIELRYNLLGEEEFLLDPFSQLDIRIDKKWNFKQSSFNLFFEVQNLLSATIPTPTEYGLARERTGELKNPPQLEPIAQSEGQFIPSIGIVFDF